jgi:hypothetical protein
MCEGIDSRHLTLWAALLLAALSGCRGGDSPTFESPWLDAVPTDRGLTAEFMTEVGSELPGAGFFRIDDLTRGDLSRVAVHEVGGTWPVVQVQILDHSDEGWQSLELDVSLSAWIAGSVPLDGEAAVGRLVLADGVERYLGNGTIQLDQAGIEPGARVRGQVFAEILEVR